MALSGFDLERVRLQAAQSLPPPCFDDFLRLTRSILHGPAFQWLIVDAPDDALRLQVMEALDGVLRAAGLRINRLPLGRRVPDVPALEQRLVDNAGRYDVVHVLGARGWFDKEGWDAFNVRRERIAANVRVRLVFWLDPAAIELASQAAPDLWAWRGGVYAFRPLAPVAAASPRSGDDIFVRRYGPIDARPMGDKYRRIGEIRAWLENHPDAPDDLLVAPLDELGALLYSVGDYDAALVHWRERELPLHRARHDETAVATTMGQIADVLAAQGDVDEALRIRREEQLPVFDRSGDVRARALTMGRIADLLETQGRYDEVLRIRREEELPVYENLGDERARAITLAQIADALEAQGHFDEAIRIRREEALPAFERLDDVESRASIMGRIANVLQARGEIDEALRIRREEQLPVYERIGDVRGRAYTMGRIAEGLAARGNVEEALRIHREEEIPVYERTGDARGRAIAMGRIADLLESRGDADEALRIRREEQLPVYERIGDAVARAVTESKIAAELWRRGEVEDALALFERAHATLTALRLPEARRVAEAMRRLGIETAPDRE